MLFANQAAITAIAGPALNLGAAPPALLPLIACAVVAALGVYAWLRTGGRASERGRIVLALLGVAALAALAHAIELALLGRPSGDTWRALRYLALGLLPALALALASHSDAPDAPPAEPLPEPAESDWNPYLRAFAEREAREEKPRRPRPRRGKGSWRPRGRAPIRAILLAGAGSLGVLGFAAAATDDLHGLFVGTAETNLIAFVAGATGIGASGATGGVGGAPGPLYLAFVGLAAVLTLAAAALAARRSPDSPRRSPSRTSGGAADRGDRPSSGAAAAIVAPLVAGVPTALGLAQSFDLAVLGLVPAAALLVVAAARAGWLDRRTPPAPRADVLESLDDGVLILDSGGRVAEANSAAARLLGMPTPSGLVGRRFESLLPEAPPDVRDVDRPSPDAPRLERPWQSAPLGDGRTVALQVHPLATLASGARQVVVVRNVTAQTRVIESLVDEREEIHRRRESVETANLKLLQRNVELTKDHEQLEALARGLEARLRDVSLAAERSREAAELEALRLQVIIDQLPDGLLILETVEADGDGGEPARNGKENGGRPDSRPTRSPHLAVVNAAARRFWPATLDLGRAIGSDAPIGWPSAAEPLIAAIDLSLDERRSVAEVRTNVVGADGVERSLVLSAAPLIRGGRPAAVAVLRDVTGLAAELEARAEFVSFVSHELRAPLTVIRGYVQSLIHDLAQDPASGRARVTPSEASGSLRAIDRQTSRMLGLVNDLLDISRMEAGRFAISPEPTLVVQFLERVCRDLRLATRTHQVGVSFAPGLEYVVALWDQNRIEQVVANLVQNAAKHGPEGSAIEIRVLRERAVAVRVSVRDEGPGIAPEHRERVFERYYQAPSDRTSSGLGLGLYISREIVAAHGGRIWIESEPGRGATFIFTLPTESDPDD